MAEQENFENNQTEEFKVTDKRRININGEQSQTGDMTTAKEEKTDLKSPELVALESEFGKERERREAAEKKLVEVQARFETIKTQLERETADMRERMRKTLEERAKQGQFDFLITLLPILDNLNLAIKAAESGTTSENLISGIKGTASGFEHALASVGVEAVPATGAQFDPELHEAVDAVEAAQDNIITKEYSRGYKFGDRLLRPARVQVGRAAANAAAE